MRILYDYGRGGREISRVPLSPRIHSESVLVISSERKAADIQSGGKTFSGGGYDVQISAEALARDSEVRAHESAHLAALGSAAASGIVYDTVTGPGGETIAVGGRIAVDLSEVPGDPEATLRKANAIITAANAPSHPSTGDMRTAAKAYDLARKAQEKLQNPQKQTGDIDIRA